MRKLLAIAVLLIASQAWGATYYLRGDGSAANKGAASSCGDASTSMSAAVHNGETFSAGDTITFCGDATGGVVRANIVVPSSGSAGNVITYNCASSPCTVNGADVFSSWTSEGGADLSADDNLVGLWKMEDNGNQTDSSSAANTLTNEGPSRNSTKVEGTYSQSFTRSSNHYFNRSKTDLSATFPGKVSIPFTVGAWINVSAGNTGNRLMIAATTYSWYLEKAADDYLRFNSWDDTGTEHNAVSNAAITDNTGGTWIHVVGRYDGSVLNVFVNGTKQTANTSHTSLQIIGSSNLRIGMHSDITGYFDGLIDEVFVFNRALTDEEIIDIYNNTVAGTGAFALYYKTSTIDPYIVMQNTTLLSPSASKEAMTTGSSWFDDPNNRIYVRTTGDDSPAGYTMQVAQRPASTGIIQYNGKSYITIDGINSTISRDACIHNYPGGAGQTTLVYKNGESSYSWNGQVTFGSDSVYVSNVTVDNVTVSEANMQNPGGNEAVTFQYTDGCELKNSTIHDFYQEAVDMKHLTRYCSIHNNHIYNQKPSASYSAPAIYCDYCSHIVVYNNKVHGLHRTASDYADAFFLNDEPAGNTIDNVTLHHNLFYDTGVGINIAGSTTTNVSNINIYNNVIADTTNQALTFNNNISGHYSGTNNIKNNIFWLNGYDIQDETTGNEVFAETTISYNLFKTGHSTETEGTSAVVTATDPFVNYGAWDFHLTTSSPAKDAGVDVGLTRDYDGYTVPRGAAPDIGAYEWADTPLLISPAQNAVGLGFPIVFTWEGFHGAVSYEMQVDDNSDFSSPEMDVFTDDTTVEGDDTDGLELGTHYYWRVRALR